jgi:RNA polymerase sigma-70 factor (sigma-E family)
VAEPGRAALGAFDETYRSLWWPMIRLAAVLVDDVGAAEDVVQDAFTGLYRRWDTIADLGAVPAYLRVSVVNGSRSALRRRGTARKHLMTVREDDGVPMDEPMLLSADHEMARRALGQLPGRQREVLTLRYISELSDAEIAQTTGISTVGVRSAASRGLATLRERLEGKL